MSTASRSSSTSTAGSCSLLAQLQRRSVPLVIRRRDALTVVGNNTFGSDASTPIPPCASGAITVPLTVALLPTAASLIPKAGGIGITMPGSFKLGYSLYLFQTFCLTDTMILNAQL